MSGVGDATLGVPSALAWTEAGGVDEELIATALRARKFAREIMRPAGLELDRRLEHDHDHFAWDLVRAGAAEGWLTAVIPTAWGGGGIGIAPMAAAMEELCAGDAGIANIYGAHGLGLLPLMLARNMGLTEQILRAVSRGANTARPTLCAFAITEPGGGSDVEERDGLALGEVGSYAVAVPGGYRLHGRKVFISNGSVATYVVVYAALDRADRASSWTAFLVERGDPGFRCARVENKLGQRACPAAELEFDGVFVPTERRIGDEGQGWELTRKVLAVSRGPVGAIATGIARDAFEAAVDYVQAKRATGGKVDPWVDELLAYMAVRIRVARAAYMEASLHVDHVLMPGRAALRAVTALARLPVVGPRAVQAISRATNRPAAEAWAHQAVVGATAKVTGSNAAMAITTECLDIIPPTAKVWRARAEKAFRDAKLTQIYEGTNQINLRSIAHESWLRGLG